MGNRWVVLVVCLSCCVLGAGIAQARPTSGGSRRSSSARPVAGRSGAEHLDWCGEAHPTDPCIADLNHNGVRLARTNATWSVQASAAHKRGPVSVTVLRNGGKELGDSVRSDVFHVTLRFADWVPRMVTGAGREVTVTHHRKKHYEALTVEATPVLVSGACTSAAAGWTCPEQKAKPTGQVDGLLRFRVSNAGSYPKKIRKAMDGFHFFTDTAASGYPTFTRPGGNPVLDLGIANRRFESNGTTVVRAHGELRLPNSLVKAFFGLPNPSTVRATSLVARLSGNTSTGYVVYAKEASGEASLVAFDGIGFPAGSPNRTLSVSVGTITPTKPRNLRAVRRTSTSARLHFDAAKPSGAKVVGYQARCRPKGTGRIINVKAKASPIHLTGLHPRRGYTCWVRALSKVGHGQWGSSAALDAKP